MTPSVVNRLLRRRWTLIIAVLVVAVVGFTVWRLHGLFGSNNVLSRSDYLDLVRYLKSKYALSKVCILT